MVRDPALLNLPGKGGPQPIDHRMILAQEQHAARTVLRKPGVHDPFCKIQRLPAHRSAGVDQNRILLAPTEFGTQIGRLAGRTCFHTSPKRTGYHKVPFTPITQALPPMLHQHMAHAHAQIGTVHHFAFQCHAFSDQAIIVHHAVLFPLGTVRSAPVEANLRDKARVAHA